MYILLVIGVKKEGIYHSIQDYVQDGFDGLWTEIQNNKVVSDQNCYAYLSNMSILPNGDIFTCFSTKFDCWL